MLKQEKHKAAFKWRPDCRRDWPIVDLQMPGMDGMKLQQRLVSSGVRILNVG